MAFVSWYHEGLDRFVQFAEEAHEHMTRSGWVRKDNPADAPTPEVEAISAPVDPPVPPPVGDDIIQGPVELPVEKPEDETDPAA